MPIIFTQPVSPVTYGSIILGTTSATPIGYWSGDAELGLTMTDLTGNGYDLSRPVDTTLMIGQVNQAVQWYSGAVGDSANITSTSFPAGTFTTTGWSAEAWVNPTVFDQGIYFPMIHVYDDVGLPTFSMGIAQPNFGSSDPFRIQVNNSGIVVNTGNVGSLTGWQHIAVSWNKSTTTGKVYLNGVEVASSNIGNSGDTTTHDTIVVGADGASSGYKGGIDELVVYDGVLSPADITAHYNAGITYAASPSPIVGSWLLDETSGTTAANEGFAGDGTYVNSPTLGVTGLTNSGTAVTFDGVDQYVDTGVIPISPNFTMMCWVESLAAPGSSEHTGTIYGTNKGMIWDHTNPTYEGAGFVKVGASFYAATFGTLLGSTKYHLALTYDGSALRSYVNGAPVTTNSSMSGDAVADTSVLKLMRHPVNAEYMQGTLDEAVYRDDVLNDAAILAVYNAGI